MPQSSASNRTGVLLVNLGTPNAPTFWEIRAYLKTFLSDPRVIEMNRWLWWLILNGIILNLRPFKLSKLYRSIWTPEGSPLLVESRRQVEALQQHVGEDYVVALGMRYGTPSLKEGLLLLRTANVSRVVVLPLYPQYSATTTGSTFDAVMSAFKPCRHIPDIRFIQGYHAHPAYLDAMKAQIESFWATHGRPDVLVFSFHGLPQRYCEAGDPYETQCRETAKTLAECLKLTPSEWRMTFQSRVGWEPWLQPYTETVLARLPQMGAQHVQVFCPGFAADCLETLEEIAVRHRHTFEQAGGKTYQYIPALNSSSLHIEMMGELVNAR